MTELLTHSRLKTYRECPRKERLSYQLRFRPVRESEAFRDGTLIHLGLEAYWKNDGDSTAMLAALGEIPDAFQKAKIEELLLGYAVRWASEMPSFKVLAVEAQFEMPLLNPSTMHPSPLWKVGGKVDGIVERFARKTVLEHKTTVSAIDSEADGYWERLAMDHQLSIYVLGAISLGHSIDDCLYDVIRKPGLRPLKATPEENRKYKKDGTLYANQRESDEPADEYRLRLAGEIALNPEKYYQRKTIPRMNSQLEEFMFDAWQTAATLRESISAGRAPRNPENCFSFGTQNRCHFWEVCTLGVDPATSPDFRKSEVVHEELGAMEVAQA